MYFPYCSIVAFNSHPPVSRLECVCRKVSFAALLDVSSHAFDRLDQIVLPPHLLPLRARRTQDVTQSLLHDLSCIDVLYNELGNIALALARLIHGLPRLHLEEHLGERGAVDDRRLTLLLP